MSFGEAVSRRARMVRLDEGARCPCGSGDPFGGCCAPLLRGEPAPTAERLMRSRYTAFCLGEVDHLARTWHPRTRPARIDADPALRWMSLEVLDVEAGGVSDAVGAVEFIATWSDGDGAGTTRGTLRERSRFVRRGARWVYLDGEVR